MSRHELPDGQWAEFRDPEQVPERLRRPITRHAARLSSTSVAEASDGDVAPHDLDILFDLNDALVLALVESWSFPSPVAADGLGELPGPAYDALLKLASPSMLALLPDFGPSPDPASPTPPSADTA